MGSNPANLVLRFVLELAALGAVGWWGWRLGSGATRFVLAAAFPVVLAVLWGVLAVPGDPSRSGSAVFPVPGLLRLIFELAFFALAVWALHAVGRDWLAILLGAAVLVHYALSYDRIGWLLAR
jgi:hypothetical protein